MSTKDVVGRLRPLLRASSRKQAFKRALPAVALEDGTLADSPEAAMERWIRHFSAIEGGSVCTEADLVQAKKSFGRFNTLLKSVQGSLHYHGLWKWNSLFSRFGQP